MEAPTRRRALAGLHVRLAGLDGTPCVSFAVAGAGPLNGAAYRFYREPPRWVVFSPSRVSTQCRAACGMPAGREVLSNMICAGMGAYAYARGLAGLISGTGEFVSRRVREGSVKKKTIDTRQSVQGRSFLFNDRVSEGRKACTPSIQKKYSVEKRKGNDINLDRTKARGFTILMEIKDCFYYSLMNKGYDEKSSTDLSEYLLKNFIAVFGGTQNYIPTGVRVSSCDAAEMCFEKWNSGKMTTIQASKEMGVTVRHAHRVLMLKRKELINSLRKTRPE